MLLFCRRAGDKRSVWRAHITCHITLGGLHRRARQIDRQIATRDEKPDPYHPLGKAPTSRTRERCSASTFHSSSQNLGHRHLVFCGSDRSPHCCDRYWLHVGRACVHRTINGGTRRDGEVGVLAPSYITSPCKLAHNYAPVAGVSNTSKARPEAPSPRPGRTRRPNQQCSEPSIQWVRLTYRLTSTPARGIA